MKKMYVVTLNMLIAFNEGVKADLDLIGVYDTEEGAKEGAIAYVKHHVAEEPQEDRKDLEETIHELIEIKEVDLNMTYPSLKMDCEKY